MIILGISAYYHDSAAAIVKDGEIIAAAQEERFTRKKHDSGFPENAIAYCLKAAETDISKVDNIVFYDKPFLKFERILETYMAFAPKGFVSFCKAMPVWVKEKLFQKSMLAKAIKKSFGEFDEEKLLFTEHHLSHAASAFFPSPFEEAIILNMDGVGEWATTSVCLGKGNDIKVLKEQHFPHSLGMLYSAFTYYTGFKVNSGEYKIMGLAPYGEPKYADVIKEKLIDLKEDGSFRLDMSYFNYCTGLTMTSEKFHKLFGEKPRKPEEKLTQKHMDLTASVQAVTEEIILKMTRSLRKEYGIDNLCLAGGVALNCVANGKVLRDGHFKNIWIQPAAGDAGGALGSALAVYHMFKDNERKVNKNDSMKGAYLGPEFTQKEIEERLKKVGASFKTVSEKEMIEETAELLINENAVGWFQGRMEFGPRALGGRSILGDARSPSMQKTLNLKVKYRESFRPFAPVVLAEDVSEWFEIDRESPYMLLVADVVKHRRREMTKEEKALFGIDKLNIVRSEIPAVTHVDYSARVETAHKETNPRYHAVLERFKEKTGCAVLVNTSFNVRGEPIVCTPEDAFNCFMGTELDALVIGNSILYKKDQKDELKKDYKNAFSLD